MNTSADKRGKTFEKLLLALLTVFALFFTSACGKLTKEKAAQHLEQVIQQFQEHCQECHQDIPEDTLEKLHSLNLEHPEPDTLFFVVLLGDAKLVQYVLDHGAEINAKDPNGLTALMVAATEGHTEIVKALLDAGADVNAKRGNGTTALMLSAVLAHTEIVKLLLAAGAEINAKGPNGLTALRGASAIGHAEIVRILKAAGAKE